MITHLETENFNELISSDLTLVDFHATWCGPCKMLTPVLESIASLDNINFKIVKIDIDQHENLAREYGIMSVPTMIAFKDGKAVKAFQGFMPKEEILNQMEGL